MPTLDRVLETALYFDDLERAARFYEDVLQLKPLVQSERLHAFDVGGKSVLLLFRRGGSLQITSPHDGTGPIHAAFAVAASELPWWEERLTANGISIEERTDWSRGGHSIYFRDPEGHLLELASPGVWETY
jgi:catechol 2,3-dioxygenase-like lactoylglutathione lyase family enzyme